MKRRKQSTVRRYQNAAKTQRLVSSTVALRRCRVMAATDRGLLWDQHHPAAGSFPSRPEVLDPAQWLPLGLQVQLAAGDHFE